VLSSLYDLEDRITLGISNLYEGDFEEFFTFSKPLQYGDDERTLYALFIEIQDHALIDPDVIQIIVESLKFTDYDIVVRMASIAYMQFIVYVFKDEIMMFCPDLHKRMELTDALKAL